MTIKTSHKVQGLVDDLHLFCGGDAPLLLLSADMDALKKFTCVPEIVHSLLLEIYSPTNQKA